MIGTDEEQSFEQAPAWPLTAGRQPPASDRIRDSLACYMYFTSMLTARLIPLLSCSMPRSRHPMPHSPSRSAERSRSVQSTELPMSSIACQRDPRILSELVSPERSNLLRTWLFLRSRLTSTVSCLSASNDVSIFLPVDSRR